MTKVGFCSEVSNERRGKCTNYLITYTHKSLTPHWWNLFCHLQSSICPQFLKLQNGGQPKAYLASPVDKNHTSPKASISFFKEKNCFRIIISPIMLLTTFICKKHTRVHFTLHAFFISAHIVTLKWKLCWNWHNINFIFIMRYAPANYIDLTCFMLDC